ncbi:MAG TPA: LysM peptidoglycan-binding domain-containing protein [Anaerolineaceae bacterium]|jgi:LysM repeat protein|nr:LysM peptidoglycan-binding domain-containing protein [Anaerolineaceae bacterium]
MKKIQTEKISRASQNCPVCGTRISETATRCLVCGTALDGTATSKKEQPITSKRIPEVKMSLGALIGLGLLLLALIGVVIFLVINQQRAGTVAATETEEPTQTATPTMTISPTNTPTLQPEPTWTPLPPLDYTVKANETCSDIAAQFNVSVQSIILANNLGTDCMLSEGRTLKVPQPTLTPSPVPTATPEAMEIAADICTNTVSIVVSSSDTLQGIAMNYNVDMKDIQDFNKLTGTTIRQGDTLVIPLCDRLPTPGPTLTPTPLPPYPAPNLLLPRSGEAFSATDEGVTLQWAAVAALRSNEVYRIKVQDLTSVEEKILVEYVTDTKFILPSTFRPADGNPHIIQWSVTVARQINEDNNNPIYEEAGVMSSFRVFSWIGTGVQPTPAP